MRHTLSNLLAFLFILVVGLGSTASSHAQNVGIGGQIGEPSGVTLKLYNSDAPSYDLLAAWSLQSDEFFLNAHVLFERRIQTDNLGRPLEWFVGPGGFVELTDDQE